MTDTSPAPVLLVGAGWRGQTFARVIAALPDQFRLSGVVTRDPSKCAEIVRHHGVQCSTDLHASLRRDPAAFVLLATPWASTAALIETLSTLTPRVPVLAETPPAPDLEGLQRLASVPGAAGVQIAEQYPLQPAHAARLALAKSGKLGQISFASASVAHGYHAVALIRRALDVGFELPKITTHGFKARLVEGPARNGPPASDQTRESTRVVSWLDFGHKLGEYDFDGAQYFSWIRGRRLLIRGDRGELENDCVRWLSDYRTPIETRLTRSAAGEDGNLEGLALRGIVADGAMVYRSSFFPARLSDDELAMAELLAGMTRYVRGGPAVYPLADGCQDQYLALCIERALSTGQTVTPEPQAWMKPGGGS